MSCDSIWFCPNLYSGCWDEYYHLKSHGRHVEAKRNLDRYGNRFVVRLSTYENLSTEALYMFLSEDDARRFFTGERLKEGERWCEDERVVTFQSSNPMIGFDDRSLRINEKLIAAFLGRKYETRRNSSPLASLSDCEFDEGQLTEPRKAPLRQLAPTRPKKPAHARTRRSANRPVGTHAS
jgi:hypothetical protein